MLRLRDGQADLFDALMPAEARVLSPELSAVDVETLTVAVERRLLRSRRLRVDTTAIGSRHPQRPISSGAVAEMGVGWAYAAEAVGNGEGGSAAHAARRTYVHHFRQLGKGVLGCNQGKEQPCDQLVVSV